MKLISVCVLFSVCCLGVAKPAWAQNDLLRAKVDSLRRILSQKKTTKDSTVILQQMADAIPVRAGETAFYPDYGKKLLELNKSVKLIDPLPYQLMQDGNRYWNNKQYLESLKSFQAAVEAFDKQHKVIYPLLMNIRILYNLLDDQEARLKYFEQKLEYYQVNGPVENTAPCYHAIGGYYLTRGAYNQAINNYLQGAELYRRFDPHFYVNVISVVGNTYTQWGNTQKASYYLKSILPFIKRINDSSALGINYYTLSQVSFIRHDYTDALNQINEALRIWNNTASQRSAGLLSFKAGIYLKIDQPELAFPILNRLKSMADSVSYKTVSSFGSTEVDYGYYQYYQGKGDIKKAEKYLLDAYKKVTDEKGVPLQLKYLRELGDFYQRQNKPELAGKYFDQYFKVFDAQENGLDEFKVAQYEIDQNDRAQKEHINQLKQEKAVKDYQISRRNSLLWGSLVVLFLISGLLVFIYMQLQINKKTLISLRKTQRQLIQSEKMASLGELTAGIAHEIQNPLNFVNNFSEVSIELLEEMEAELKRGETEEAIDIAGDVKQNLEKISHHGKRADGIVKGMLQHSRASSGQKEPTDINVLADEYFRLAYHGLRAKDKTFNAEMVTHFDDNLPKMDTIPQDIGRALLNLFTNAFYAIHQKQRSTTANYQPTVWLSTRAITSPSGGWGVEIRVKDNGTGIPERVKDKIMQPFFTTKPTGEGTGLGLSMSYDIVVKGHGGSMDVDTKEGEYTEFIIKLPLN